MTTPNIKPEDVKRLITKDENGLLPCPFCGDDAYQFERYSDPIICCSNEKCELSQRWLSKKAWNTRAYAPAILTLLRLLDEAGEALSVARKRIDYFGVMIANDRDYEANLKIYLPKLDQALTAIQPYRGLGGGTNPARQEELLIMKDTKWGKMPPHPPIVYFTNKGKGRKIMEVSEGSYPIFSLTVFSFGTIKGVRSWLVKKLLPADMHPLLDGEMAVEYYVKNGERWLKRRRQYKLAYVEAD